MLEPSKKQRVWLRTTSITLRTISFGCPRTCNLAGSTNLLAASQGTLEVVPPPYHPAPLVTTSAKCKLRIEHVA